MALDHALFRAAYRGKEKSPAIVVFFTIDTSVQSIVSTLFCSHFYIIILF